MQINADRGLAVITGASSGLGAELARQLGAKGYSIGLVARRKELLQELAENLRQQGIRVVYAVADVSDTLATKNAVELCQAEFGPCQLMVANAGIGYPVLAAKFDAKKAVKIVEVNVNGVINAFGAVLADMVERGQGQLVAVSSLAAYRSFPQSHVYCASKSAVNALMEGLRLELAGRKIYFTTICPGFVKTPMTEGNTISMPLVLECPEAVSRMVAAIEAKKRVYNFPRRLYWVARLSRVVPEWVWLLIFGKFFKKPYKIMGSAEG